MSLPSASRTLFFYLRIEKLRITKLEDQESDVKLSYLFEGGEIWKFRGVLGNFVMYRYSE